MAAALQVKAYLIDFLLLTPLLLKTVLSQKMSHVSSFGSRHFRIQVQLCFCRDEKNSLFEAQYSEMFNPSNLRWFVESDQYWWVENKAFSDLYLSTYLLQRQDENPCPRGRQTPSAEPNECFTSSLGKEPFSWWRAQYSAIICKVIKWHFKNVARFWISIILNLFKFSNIIISKKKFSITKA